MTGIELIAKERERQIVIERRDSEDDMNFNSGAQLAGAAGCYIANAINKQYESETTKFEVIETTLQGEDAVLVDRWVDGWPWNSEFDKREKHDQRRSLVIAGALIAAELDRLNYIKNGEK